VRTVNAEQLQPEPENKQRPHTCLVINMADWKRVVSAHIYGPFFIVTAITATTASQPPQGAPRFKLQAEIDWLLKQQRRCARPALVMIIWISIHGPLIVVIAFHARSSAPSLFVTWKSGLFWKLRPRVHGNNPARGFGGSRLASLQCLRADRYAWLRIRAASPKLDFLPPSSLQREES
jgi:hypothetical protein